MGSDEPASPGFEVNIKPLFREKDRTAMRGAFDLWAYDDVATHADAIAQELSQGRMPCDGPWPEAQVTLFQRWIDAGKAR